MITYQQFVTKPDVNGNSRRGWLIGRIYSGKLTNAYRVIAWVDEEGRGYAPLDDMLEGFGSNRLAAVDLGSVHVEPNEYRELVYG